MHGQASRPARTHLVQLSRVTATADTNTDERSATSQRQGEGAWLWRDVGSGVGRGDAEVTIRENRIAVVWLNVVVDGHVYAWVDACKAFD